MCAALTSESRWDLGFRTRKAYLLLTNDARDVDLLSHYKPGFSLLLRLANGEPSNNGTARYAHGALFTFRNTLLAPHYATQCSADAILVQVGGRDSMTSFFGCVVTPFFQMRPAPYLFEMGVRFAFLVSTWLRPSLAASPHERRTGPVASLDLVRLRQPEGMAHFTSYMQESLAPLAASNARLAVVGDRIVVLRGPGDVQWDSLIVFVWKSADDLAAMLATPSYQAAHRHWANSMESQSVGWTFQKLPTSA